MSDNIFICKICNKSFNIKILRKKIRNIFYYIEKTYGKHYLKQFKNHK